VLEQKACSEYAPYFGLPIYLFRQWIEMQFDEDTNWTNFSKKWQFEHIVPINYFDFLNKDDLRLCWNFVNVRVSKIDSNQNPSSRLDVLSAKTYIKQVFDKTGYFRCQELIQKIETIEASQLKANDKLELFILENINSLADIRNFSQDDFERVNDGMSIDDILSENRLLAKYSK
jgi:hypothetical protein